MSRAWTLQVASFALAIVTTILLGVHLAAPDFARRSVAGLSSSASGSASTFTAAVAAAASRSAFQFLLGNSPILSAASWAAVGGVWIWRGRVKSRWESLGFDSGTFDLFMKMKGARTRLSLLDALSIPKDRLQLARELGLDWKAVDYHIALLNRYGLVHEDRAFGKVRIFRLTSLGETLLRLLKEFDGGAPEGIGQRATIQA